MTISIELIRGEEPFRSEAKGSTHRSHNILTDHVGSNFALIITHLIITDNEQC